jgi:hypothetical protein
VADVPSRLSLTPPEEIKKAKLQQEFEKNPFVLSPTFNHCLVLPIPQNARIEPLRNMAINWHFHYRYIQQGRSR